MELSFIVIDDSELDCFIAKKMIEQTLKNARIRTFFAATEALANITLDTMEVSGDTNIMLLDLMMPKMNGFQFIEAFETLSREIQEKYFIVALTSSMNRNDITRLNGYKTVHMVLDKPITTGKIQSIIMKAIPGFSKIPN